MTKKIVNEVKPAINTLEAEGKALADLWKARQSKDRAAFTADTKADGFDTRLGKLMFALKQEGGERISSQRLKDCGIAGIDKRRRSEALWFVENEKACRDFIAKAKRGKGFTSLTALQAAMRKATKVADKPEQPKAENKSNVGPKQPKAEQSKSEPKAKRMTADDVAVSVLDMLEQHEVSLADFEKSFEAIKAILKDEDKQKKAA